MNQVSQRTLNEAYQIVQDDLSKIFRQMKDGESIRLTNLGTFAKRWKKNFSGLTGKIHTYYQINFQMSKVLKQALTK